MGSGVRSVQMSNTIEVKGLLFKVSAPTKELAQFISDQLDKKHHPVFDSNGYLTAFADDEAFEILKREQERRINESQ